MSRASLTLDSGNLVLKTPYDRGLVDDLKSIIPYKSRQWNPSQKAWIIAYMYGQDVVDIVSRHLGISLSIPKQITQANPDQTIIRQFKIEYIGAAKERHDGIISATGYCDGQWSVILPLDVLRLWFDDGSQTKPNQISSLYVVLGVKQSSTDKEIKRAHRIAAKTWHPDLNDDPDAPAQFRRIQEAYEILSDTQQRKKYNAGLYLQQQAEKNSNNELSSDEMLAQYGIWKPPKRCGYLTVECRQNLMRFTASKILEWSDITENGLTMVSYWPKSGDGFEVDWI